MEYVHQPWVPTTRPTVKEAWWQQQQHLCWNWTMAGLVMWVRGIFSSFLFFFLAFPFSLSSSVFWTEPQPTNYWIRFLVQEDGEACPREWATSVMPECLAWHTLGTPFLSLFLTEKNKSWKNSSKKEEGGSTSLPAVWVCSSPWH